MTRILTTALSALFTLTATGAFAAPSVVTADSILVREDTVRLEYNSKTGGCAALRRLARLSAESRARIHCGPDLGPQI